MIRDDNYCEACLEETEELAWDDDHGVYICEDCYQSPPDC